MNRRKWTLETIENGREEYHLMSLKIDTNHKHSKKRHIIYGATVTKKKVTSALTEGTMLICFKQSRRIFQRASF